MKLGNIKEYKNIFDLEENFFPVDHVWENKQFINYFIA